MWNAILLNPILIELFLSNIDCGGGVVFHPPFDFALIVEIEECCKMTLFQFFKACSLKKITPLT